MKKTTMKTLVASLSLAFVATAAVGVNALTADAATVTTVNPAFASLKLQGGASVRYVADATAEEQGFSYVLEMNKEAYEAVKANEDFTKVQYGILIGPEAYYQAHPFNTEENLEAWYSLNTEAEGKAFLYNMKAKELIGEGEKVFYRGSIVDVENENMIRDYRGVGYVKYSYQGGEVQTYFFTNDNVRCPVEIAEKTIETLDETEDATQITALEDMYMSYLDTIDWSVATQTAPATTWFQFWGVHEPTGSGAALKKPNAIDKNNRYINSKYTTTFAYEYEGKQTVKYTGWAGTAAEVAVQKNLEGLYNLVGRTTCAYTGEEVISYTAPITFSKVGGATPYPTVNGNTINGTSPYGMKWVEEEGMYKQNDNWHVRVGYQYKATGNFIVDFALKGTSPHTEFRIYTQQHTWIGFNSRDGGNVAGVDGIYFHLDGTSGDTIDPDVDKTGAYGSETRLKGNPSVFTNPNIRGVGALRLRVVNYNNTMYLFSNTYWNGSAVATAENYTLIAALSANGITAYNGMTSSTYGMDTFKTAMSEFYEAATSNEFAFGFRSLNSGVCYKLENLEDNDAKVLEFLNSTPSMAIVNDQVVTSVKDSTFAYNQVNNTYTSTTVGATRMMGVATGDWMARVKLNSATTGNSNVELRIQSAPNKYIRLRSGVDGQGQSGIFFRTEDGVSDCWPTETFVGFNTAQFVNEDDCTAEGSDGYLDLIIVRTNNEIQFYACEYLNAEGKAVDHESWQLIFAVNADGVATIGANLTAKDAWGNATTTTKGAFLNMAKVVAAANQNAIFMVMNTGTFEGNVWLNDDDATVAAFVASDKKVADYPKA